MPPRAAKPSPFATATLAVLTPHEIRLWEVVRNLMSAQFLEIMIVLSAMLLTVGALVWLLERGHNQRQFHKSPILGLGDGFWWAGVTLTTIGYGDKTPVTLWGRAVAMLWMLIGLGVSAALTASVVTATNIEGNTGVEIPSGLRGMRVAAVSGSSTARYLYSQSVAVDEFASYTAALSALGRGEVEAVAGSAPELLTAAAESNLRYAVSSSALDPQYVAIGLPQPSTPAETARVEAIRAAVLRRLTGDGWWRIVERYEPATLR